MRETKFRGRRVEDGEWVYGCYNYNPLLNRAEIFFCDTVRMYVYEVDPETVGQFTGLCDKNGKEIYEGDIILADWRSTPCKWRVYRNPETQYWDIVNQDGILEGLYDYHFDCIVIGDIHNLPKEVEPHEATV